MKGKCYRCGSPDHMANNCSVAKSATPWATLRPPVLRQAKLGQLTNAIRQLPRTTLLWPWSTNQRVPRVNYVMAFTGSGDHHSFPTPPGLLWLALAENEASSIYLKCCPDTGATQIVIHERIARQAGLVLNPPRIGMNSITGPLDIVEEANVVLKFDGLRHTTFALIARGMDFACLIAWHDLQPLEVISNTLPARISASASHDLTSSIVNDFPSVFVEILSKSPMNVQEMKIHLTDPYVPYRVSTARQVPLRFQTMAEQIVMDLIKAQVIF